VFSYNSNKPRKGGLQAILCLGVGISALTAFSAPAMAQEETEEETRTLQAVTITATKREQTLQDVPIAVSVVGADVIEKAEIVDLGDLQSIVPSLRVGQLQSSANTNFVIRGFGNGANNAGIEPSVGVFIDGVYRSRSASQISDLPNIERVEVLRGPQSTLFGKNASAGVISVVTKKPTFETEGSVEGTLSNFNGRRVGGYFTAPISDKVAFSVSGNYNVRDGYVEDIGDGPDTNERNRYGVRGELLFEPSENLSFRLIGDYDQIDEICCAAVNVVNGPTGGIVNALGGQIVAGAPFSNRVAYNFGSQNEIENSGVSLQGDYDAGFATLTSITAFRTSDLVQNADSDFTSADLIGRNANETNIETFTQELRLTSSGDGNIDWMIGGFYFDEKVAIENDFQFGADFRGYVNVLSGGAIGLVEGALQLPVGTTFGQAGQGPLENFGQDNQAYSLFGTVDWHLSDRLTATLGLNYTKDEKSAFGNAINTDSFSAVNLTQVGYNLVLQQLLAGQGVDLTNPASVGPFVQNNAAQYAVIQQQALAVSRNPSTNPLGGLTALQFLPPFLAFPNAVEDGQTNDSDTTYTLRLAYDVNDNINVYGSYGTGFKATSWNLSRDSRPFGTDFVAGNQRVVDPVTQQVFAAPSSPITNAGLGVTNLTTGTRYAGPEQAKVFEIGLKAAFDSIAFNIAVFDQTIEGFQSNVFTGTGFSLANAGEQSTQGIELDATWNATENLTLTFAGTFQDPVYDSFVASATGDISGTTPSGIPETATSTSATYTFDVGNLASFVRADWQYESPVAFFDATGTGFTGTDNQALIGAEKEISTVNASAGFTTEGGLGVTFWGRNIFDDEYITTAFPGVAQAGTISGYPSAPPTYGVTIRKSF
jgi:outer membrane receptor protein involved in Fe transport